jgi:replicative DNA helicase
MNSQEIVENECRILSGSLYNHEWLEVMTNRLTVEDFTCPETRTIFATIDSLAKRDSEVTFSKISELIDPNAVPMPMLLKLLAYAACGSDHLKIIESIKEVTALNRLHEIGVELLSAISAHAAVSSEILRSHESRLFSLIETRRNLTVMPVQKLLSTPKHFSAIVDERREKFRRGDDSFDGIPSHFSDLDKLMRGFGNGHFIVIGSRPSVGKTTFATNLIENVTLKSQARALIFTLEMTNKEVVEKIIAQTTEVPSAALRDGSLTDEQVKKIFAACDIWSKQVTIFDDQASLSIDQIKSRSLRAKKIHDINIIFVDYLQLATSKANSDFRHLEISDISRGLKQLAKDLNVPVIALAQLSRKVEERENKTPILSDLRESGSIEADADEVILLHRPELYDPMKKRDILEVFVLKNRFGATGRFDLHFDKPTGKMNNMLSYYAK